MVFHKVSPKPGPGLPSSVSLVQWGGNPSYLVTACYSFNKPQVYPDEWMGGASSLGGCRGWA